MTQIRPLENPFSKPLLSDPSSAAPPKPGASEPPPLPTPYSQAALFRRLENGVYAITGQTGDSWDVATAPEWRSKSKVLDPFLVQASNAVGSFAFATNVLNNAGGRIFSDIPAVVDNAMKQTVGVDFDETSLIFQSITPGNPFDELPFYLLARASQISTFGKNALFRKKLIVVAERFEHIEANHGWVNLNLKKSLYFPDVDIQKLIQKAAPLKKIPQKGGKFAQVGTAKELIGLDRQTGLPTKIYTVISDAQGKVVTSHPGLPDPNFALP